MRENAWGSVRPAFALKNSGREGGMGGRPLSPPPTRGISARKIFQFRDWGALCEGFEFKAKSCVYKKFLVARSGAPLALRRVSCN